MNYICFDVGGTAVKHALLTEDGTIVQKNQFPTVHTSKDAFLASLKETVQEYEKEYSIESIGISMPGTIDPYTGESILAGALYSLYGENVKELLEAEVSLPVFIENDANCALLAEKFNGNAVGVEDILLLTIGTGIGGALMIDNQLIYGHQYKAGEFGMMHIDISRRPNTTLHELASTSALIRFYKESKKLSEERSVEGIQIFEEMETDSEVKSIVDEWVYYLAKGIFNVASFVNPQKILIGGGISANPKLLPLILQTLDQNPYWEDFGTTVETCLHQNNAGLIGVLFYVLKKTKELNKKGAFHVPPRT